MSRIMVFFVCLFVFTACSAGYSQPSQEEYQIEQDLATSLLKSPYSLFTIRELFFPRLGSSPVCIPIKYELTCINDTDFSYNKSFLWTSYDAESYVGQILLSSAYYGILVRGFDWETACLTDSLSQAVLGLELTSCGNQTADKTALDKELLALTVAIKAYGTISDKLPTGDALTSNKAYAIEWKQPEEENDVFHTSYVILSMMVALLDFFIIVFSVGICSTIYDAIFNKIKDKKNPYYPLFTGVILCSILWNAGPGWLVLRFDTNHIKYSFAVLIPLQLIIALFMKKYPDFPIPGFPCSCKSTRYTYLDEVPPVKYKSKSEEQSNSYFFWEICYFKKGKLSIIFSFIIQTFGVWSLLILFTFVVYYSIGITISLYLYPIQTLVKIIFIKAVAVCVVFDIAILFSGDRFDFKCTKKDLVKNINDVAMLFASITLLPVLGFIAFVAGGVIFNSSATQLSGIQGVLAILPSTILLLVGWYSKGTLFPEKLIAESGDDVKAVAVNNNANGAKDQGYGSTDTA